MTEREDVLAGFKPLFEQARRERKWFFCSYQSLWFSPDQLEAEHRQGRFLWHPDNWKLRDPAERLAAAERAIEAAISARDQIAAEMKS